jgi:hypothetical protein
MNEGLKKRIADVRKYLDEQFEGRPRKWWQYKANDYIPTRDMDTGKNYHPHNPEETIVRFDFKRALISGALFFTVTFLMFYFISFNGQALTASFCMTNMVVLVFIFFALIRGDKRGELMVFNKTGFRISTMPELVCWTHLVASYIRKENSGEDPGYFLLLYYYDEKTDEFKDIESGISGLNLSKEDIASQIEYWKMITGNSIVTL